MHELYGLSMVVSSWHNLDGGGKKRFGYDQQLTAQQEKRGCAYCLTVVQTSGNEFKAGKVVRGQQWRLVEEVVVRFREE